ncbi:MAG: hypothetical protein ACREBJ_03195 [Nitrosotalea sp.]
MSQADSMTVEVVLLLIDKWEADVQKPWDQGKLTIPELFNHYVRLKISLHHVRKAWDRGCPSMDENTFNIRELTLSSKIKALKEALELLK